MVLKTVCVQSSESMRGELAKNEGKGEQVMSERKMREERRWRLDVKESKWLRDPIWRLIVG